MLFKRFLALLVLALGLLGVAACIAGAYGVWWLGSRLEQANEKVFAALDKGVASGQDVVRGAQKRLEESKAVTIEIKTTLRLLTAKAAKERISTELNIEGRTEALANHLQTADLLLETFTESVGLIQQVLELGNVSGGPVAKGSLETLLAKLKSLRGNLEQIEKTVDGIRESAAAKEARLQDERLERMIDLIGRVLAAIPAVTTGLEELADRLAEMRTNTQQLKADVSRDLLWATVACYLILAWIGAGQIALCWWGGKNCCRSR